MAIDRLVVVGASLAGLRAVEAARKAGFDGAITLIGAEPHLPYDRPPLSKAFLAPATDGVEASPTYLREESALREELDVDLRLGAAATGLDTSARVVLVGDEQVPYDAVVVATGAHARTLPGAEGLSGVHTLRTLDDSRAIRAGLAAGARTVVIGAGFIGSEIASSAAGHGVPVTVVEAEPTPLVRATGRAMGQAIAALHERNGTRLITGVGVRALTGAHGVVEGVELDDGTVLPADLVVVGVGVTPTVEWLAGSGVPLDDEVGGIRCDATLFTGVEAVWAAGDVAAWPNGALGVRQRMQNWTAAAEQGAAAARNAIDPANATPYATVPYLWSDWYGTRIQFVGDPDAEQVEVVAGDPADPTSSRWVALYRRGDRLAGALAVQGPGEIMKYRALIIKGASWQDALDHAERRRELARRKAAEASA